MPTLPSELGGGAYNYNVLMLGWMDDKIGVYMSTDIIPLLSALRLKMNGWALGLPVKPNRRFHINMGFYKRLFN